MGWATEIAACAVRLFYKLHLHDASSEGLALRLQRQIADGLAALEVVTTPAVAPGQAEIASAWLGGFLGEAHPATCRCRRT